MLKSPTGIEPKHMSIYSGTRRIAILPRCNSACTPSAIPNLIAHWKVPFGLWRDAAATLPITANGQSVARWDNLANPANPAIQVGATPLPTATTQPSPITWAITYSGTQALASSPLTQINSTPFTLLTVALPTTVPGATSVAASLCWADAPNGTNGNPCHFNFTPSRQQWHALFRVSGLPDEAVNLAPNTQPITIISAFTLTSATISATNALRGNLTGLTHPTTTSTGVYLGSRASLTAGFQGSILEAAVWSRALSAREARRLLSYTRSQWNF